MRAMVRDAKPPFDHSGHALAGLDCAQEAKGFSALGQ